jgi:outer membrane protein OmpA-like peptidoglycan-associated protein
MNKNFRQLLATGVAVTVLSITAPIVGSTFAQAQVQLLAQSSVAEAETMLRDAIARLEQAKAAGTEPSAAEAEVAAAQAALETLRQAEAQAAAGAKAAQQAEAEAAMKAQDAQRAADAQAAQQAEADAKAAAEAEAALKAQEAQRIADEEAAKQAAAQAEADAAKAAAEAEAQKAAEDAAMKEAEAQKAEADAKAAAEAEEAKKAEPTPPVEPVAPAEPTPPVEPVAPAEPTPLVEPVAPAEPTPPVEPVAPAEPTPPVEPVAPAEPTPPVEPVVPAEPTPPVEPVVPAEPTPPVEPVAPIEPTPPVEPVPVVPAEPAPVEPAPVVEPVAPVEPAPAEPIVPAEPAPPVEPVVPVEPAPVAPAEPVVAPVPDPVLEKLPEPLPENAAPVLDSAKEVIVLPEGEPAAPAVPAEPAPPPPPAPVTDAQSIELIKPVEVLSAVTEEGVRLTELPVAIAPPAQEVVKVIDNRTIVTVNNVLVINTPDTPRLTYKDDEVLVERLPRGRTRETIIRANGVQIVTIRNRFGDIIQRSRILPDGREVFLSYSPEYDREDYVEWRDPVFDLPPLVLNIPIREYILSVSLIDDREAEFDPEIIYYDFLEKPPVERVERTYSVREVKQSARVRDKVRRIDLDTLTFNLGSADIREDQIEKLESVANAMLKLLAKNPGETFLIEGHTDAVGKDQANLILSDKRAEAVAQALTNAFEIPSENLTTQGYGERYLKVKTTKPSEVNRRVAIRRITQLVAPVALK